MRGITRRCVAALTLAVSLTATGMNDASSSAEPARDSNGREDMTSVATTRLIRLPADWEVPGPAERMGGPRYFVDQLPGLAWGFAVSRPRTHTVAAGRLRLALLENDFGVYGALALGPGRRVRSGTYLLTIFGPATRVIRSLQFPRGTAFGSAATQPVSYFADYLSQDGTEVHPTTSITYSPSPTTFTLEGVAQTNSTGYNYSANLSCLVPPDVETCAGEPTEAGGLLPGVNDASAASNWTQPGALAPGTYKRLFEATSGAAGAKAAGFWLALDTAIPVPALRARSARLPRT